MPRALHLLAQLLLLQLAAPSRSRMRAAAACERDARRGGRIEALQFPVHGPFAVRIPTPAGTGRHERASEHDEQA